MGRAQRKKGRLPPSFYIEQRAQLAAQGKTQPKVADNTTKGLASVLKKWKRFCGELGYNAGTFLEDAQVPDFKIFWKWTMDRYNRIGVASSLKNYWRVLRMHALDKADRDFDPRERRDIKNYINVLIDEYGLRTTPKKKPVIGLDDLYLLLYTHWVLDDSTFKDERQRVQVATGLLMAAFFGCRPCSLFDTRVKLDEPDDSDVPTDDTAVASAQRARKAANDAKMDESNHAKSHRDGDTGTSIDAALKVDRDSNTAWNGDSDSDSDSGSLYVCDEDCDTDDDCDAGPEETRSFLYRHFTISIVANPTPGKPNMVFMKATLLHTKGEDNNPRIKTLVIGGGDDDPLFSLLDHIISLAIRDNAFEATSAKNVENMFRVQIPPGRKSLTLKWKRQVLDLPVFREPLRGAGAVGTSPTAPLRASTWITYLKRLGQKAGFEHAFTQYGLRRGLLNVVNNSAPASVRDQLFDHQQGAVGYYLDQEIRFDTESCYLGKPSNEVVQKMARLASLTADASAPTELSSEQKTKLKQHPQVIHLGQRNKGLTTRIHATGYNTIGDAKGTPLFDKKKKAEARLSCLKIKLRNHMIVQARKRHFRKADTLAFDAQFTATAAAHMVTPDTQPAKPIEYNIPERAEVVRLTCSPGDGLSDREKLRRRIQAIEARAALCDRRETQRRGRLKSTVKQEESEGAVNESEEDANDKFPMVCRPTQSLFRLGDERLSHQDRVYEYAKPNKMMNEVEKHLKKYAPKDQVPCPHPQCKAAGLVLPSVMGFKNHTATVHKIFLRA